jgi:RNase P/RNase MRP subunit p29
MAVVQSEANVSLIDKLKFAIVIVEEEFELPIEYKGEEQMFNAKLIVTGYTHKFSVEVDGQSILFEPDEERNYRAVIPYDDIDNSKGY